MTTSLKRHAATGLAFLATSAVAFGLPQGQRDIADVTINVVDGDCGCTTSTEQFITVGLPDGTMRESEPLTNGTFEFIDVGNKFTLFFNNRGTDIAPMEFAFDGRNERIALQVLTVPNTGEIKEVNSKVVPMRRRMGNKVAQIGTRPTQPRPAGVPGDTCDSPVNIDCGSSATVDNTSATDDASDPGFDCHFSGPGLNGVGSLWFSFVATGDIADIDTNASLVSDTLLAVYDGSCGALTELACSEDEGDGFLSELTVGGLTAGNTYLIQAASYSDASRGVITVSVACSDTPSGGDGDNCADAIAVDCNSSVTVDNTSATDEATDPIFSCRSGGAGAGSGSLWFTFVATDTSARLDTELSTGATDTLLAVYDGTCGAFTEIACSEDEGVGLLSIVDVFGLTVGTTYYVQVSNFGTFSTRGDMTLQIACPAPAPPTGRCCFSDGSCLEVSEDDCLNVLGGNAWDETLTCADACPVAPDNDECDNAEDLGALPASISFDNSEATSDIVEPCGVASGPWNNVWYKVTGTGNTITASTCNAGSEVADTKISVFCSDCLNLTCVAGNDDDCPSGGQSFQSTVSWCSQPGVEYFITVGNFSDFTTPGVIQLDVTDDGVPCDADVSCVATGACCLGDGTCVITSEDECRASGGEYLGDNTVCSSNAVADPSFEAGAFGGVWTEFSLTFGTTLCDAGGCGFGGGTGPNTGDWWSWFGGIAAFEQGLVEQSVVIPVGSDTLSFALEIPAASGNGQDYMRVEIDGNTVYTAMESDGPYLGYLPISVDISAYADGLAHTVTFFSEIVGDAVTNFFVDDIEIGADVADCRECVTLDFETEDDFLTALVNGQDIDTEFGNLVVITGSGPNLGPAIFDTSEFGPNFGGNDEDLLVRTGNALILQDLPLQSVPGIYDTASDDSDGGTLSFDFVSPSEVLSVDLIDVDLGPGVQDASVVLTDVSGATRTYTVPGGWTKDIQIEGAPGYGTLDLTTLADQPGVHSTATAVEDDGFDASVVVRMDVVFSSSSALDNLSFCQ